MGDEPEGLMSGRPADAPREARAGRGSAAGTDLTFALRQLRRHPAFAAVAVLTLALGIGVTTAMFSVVHRLLIDPIPYRNGDRIVRLYLGARGPMTGDGPEVLLTPSYRVVRAWRERSRTLEQLVSMQPQPDAAVGAGGAPELVRAVAMSADVPDFFGVRLVLGRTFAAGEMAPGGESAVILGNGFWRSQFGGSRDVIGRTVLLNGTPRTIVGVMPPGITLPGDLPVGVWVPLVITSDSTEITPLGRLRPGVSVTAARRELAGILSSVQTHFGVSRVSAHVVLMRDYLGSHVEKAIVLVAAAVGVVLLIACANVANLFLARSANRHRELSMRAALGASRWRLARQFIAESLCITVLGGGVGVLLAWRIMSVVGVTRPRALGALDAAKLDVTSLVWTIGVSVLTGLVFGIVPLVIGAGRNPADVLKSVSQTVSGGRGAARARAGLIVGQVALSVTLLVGAITLVRSVRMLQHENIGVDPRGVSTIYVRPLGRHHALTQQSVLEGLVDRIRHMPGVTAATIAGAAPPIGGVSMGRFEIEDQLGRGADSTVTLGYYPVQPDYFRVLRLPIVAGELLDNDTATHTAMVSTEMAHHFWPGVSPLGKRFRFGRDGPWHVVVGVVAETKAPGGVFQLDDQLYEPYVGGRGAELIVRTNGRVPNLLGSITRMARAIDPTIHLDGRSMEADFAALFAGRRFAMFVLSVFAGFASGLSAIGLYGVIAYAVVQRTREMGVRLALGASPTAIRRLILTDGAMLVGAGVLLGTLLTMALERVTGSRLTEAGSVDPAVFIFVALLLGAIALIASYVPALRASHVDPVIALRAE